MTPNQLLAERRKTAVTPNREMRHISAETVTIPRMTPVTGDAPTYAAQPTPADIDALCHKCGVPRLKNFSADHIDNNREVDTLRHALKATRRFTRAWRSGKVGAGIAYASLGYGNGKTTLAKVALYGVSSYLVWNGNVKTSVIGTDGRFFSASALFRRVHEERDINATLSRKLPVIVIDDFGAERIGTLPYVAAESQRHQQWSIAFRIIDHCYQNNIGVIITTNETAQGFRELVGGAAWSRLQQIISAENWITLNGVRDYRPYAGGHR